MKVAADANVLLSAVIGGRARIILEHPGVEQILTTESTFAEVQEYALELGKKKKLSPELLMLTVAALPVSVVPREQFEGSMAVARERLEWRDPDDVDLLAMAIHFAIPLWTNDRDFENCGHEKYTTAELLSRLDLGRADELKEKKGSH